MKEINVQELKKMIDDKVDFQLIDVREPYEAQIANIGGELIPVNTILQNVNKIAKDKTVVIYCRSGARSANAILQLETYHEFDNLYNLKGGILAYAKEIDNSLATY
jgi:adenylyltransferase/sulfurtransferase